MNECTVPEIDLVMKIRYMMEYMTLCADPTLFKIKSPAQPYPAPNGVPMSIVVMPDFVVDIGLDSNKLDAPEVGGRSGRIVSILQDFGGPLYSWYDVKYVAETGTLGRVVLERKFSRAKSSKFPPRPNTTLRYILSSKRDNDWLRVYQRENEDKRDPESAFAGLDVSVDDIEKAPFPITDLVVNTRYLIVAAKFEKHAINALKVLGESLMRYGEGLSNEKRYREMNEATHDLALPIGILLDLSVLHKDDHPGSVIDEFKILKERANAFEFESTALCRKDQNVEVAEFDHAIRRDDTGIWLDGQKQIPRSSSGHDKSTDYVRRESFTAGYALASACNLGWRLLRKWYKYDPTMHPLCRRPLPQLPLNKEAHSTLKNGILPSLATDSGKECQEPLHALERVQFAATWEEHVSNSTPLRYYDLVKRITNEGSRYPDLAKLEFEFDENHVDPGSDEVSLATDNIYARYHDEESKDVKELSLYVPPKEIDAFVHSCRLRDSRFSKSPSKDEITKAVMFDLDATLVDSGGLLRGCWFKGLQTLFDNNHLNIDIKPNEIMTVIDIYQKFIYKNHESFRKLLQDIPDIPPEFQPCDFRQVWNHPYAWSTLLWLLEQLSIQRNEPYYGKLRGTKWSQDSAIEALKDHSKKLEEHSKNECSCMFCQLLRPILVLEDAGTARRRGIVLSFRDLLVKYRFEIQEARDAFWDVEYPCYPQARSCVQMFLAIPKCQVYIVTEGHEETQLNKLKCIGLSDLFPRERVLSTGAASAAEEARSDLYKLLVTYEQIREFLGKVENDIDSHESKLAISPMTETVEALIGSINFFKELLQVFYKKSNRRIYYAVIEAIQLNPHRPIEVLHSFTERRKQNLGEAVAGDEGDKTSRVPFMQFFMIGDRYANDCEPLLDIPSPTGRGVGVGTCLLMSGKYADKEHRPPRGRPPVMYVCDTLAQLAHIMQHQKAWERIEYLKGVTVPVLLEQDNGKVGYRRVDGVADFKELAEDFESLAWAQVDERLRYEPTLEEMIIQIERDLGVCDVVSLSSFYDDIRKTFEEWWNQALERRKDETSQDPFSRLLGSGLTILDGVNWWRHYFSQYVRVPCLNRVPEDMSIEALSQTLEWTLGRFLLRGIAHDAAVRVELNANKVGSSQPSKFVILSEREWPTDDDDTTPHGVNVKDILNAIPYSNLGICIVKEMPRIGRYVFQIDEWLKRANSVLSVARDSSPNGTDPIP